MCVGFRELQLLKAYDGTDVVLFECDGCAKGKKACEICAQSKGYLRMIEGKFYHQVCAIAHRFPLLDPMTMKFGLPDDFPIGTKDCSSCGQFCSDTISCKIKHEKGDKKSELCTKSAHPFCALNGSSPKQWACHVVSALDKSKGKVMADSPVKTTMEWTCG